MVKFTAKNLADLAGFLRREAKDAAAKGKGLARNRSDKKYYEGQEHAYNNLAAMIERGELVIGSQAPNIQNLPVPSTPEGREMVEKLGKAFHEPPPRMDFAELEKRIAQTHNPSEAKDRMVALMRRIGHHGLADMVEQGRIVASLAPGGQIDLHIPLRPDRERPWNPLGEIHG